MLAGVRAAAAPVFGEIAALPYAAIGAVHADPADPLPAREHHLLLSALPDDAMDALLAAVGDDGPQTIVELRQLGGAVARAPRHASAFCHRDAAFSLFTVGLPEPTDPGAVDRHASGILAAMAPHAGAGTLANFSADDDPIRVGRSFTPEVRQRLAVLADRYDPAGVLHTGQVVRTPIHNG